MTIQPLRSIDHAATEVEAEWNECHTRGNLVENVLMEYTFWHKDNPQRRFRLDMQGTDENPLLGLYYKPTKSTEEEQKVPLRLMDLKCLLAFLREAKNKKIWSKEGLWLECKGGGGA